MDLNPSNPNEDQVPPVPETVGIARQAWQRLSFRLRSITPLGLMRFLLIAAVVLLLGWIVETTWVALIPFVVGAVIAYVMLPLVNWMDRFLPRILAVLVAMSGVLLVVVLFFALLVPILVEQVYRAYLSLPDLNALKSYVAQFEQYLATLPGPAQETISSLYEQAWQETQLNLDSYLSRLVEITINTTLALVDTVGFIIGFLAIPSWLLYVLNDQQKGRTQLNRLLPEWMRPDFWGVVRIFDRAFGAFIRGQLLVAILVTILTYLGLELLVRLFGLEGNVRYQLFLALIAGMFQLIPSIGPFLAVIPAALIGLLISAQFSLGIIAVYIGVQQIISNFVAPRVERNVIDLHPALFIVIIVALSEISFWWVLLAAPITAIGRDLFRYAYGRVSSPPRPAGLLPDEPLPSPRSIQPVASTPPRREWLADINRHRRELRQAQPPGGGSS